MAGEAIADRELNALFALLADYRALGLAVSGGVDSMTLMHLVRRWLDGGASRGRRVQVVTVDHGLRPQARGEAEAVARQAAALGFPHEILTWQGPRPKTGVQNAAREARYDLIATHARANGLQAIVTAHHLQDQSETVVMRLARGSGIDGLAGMHPVTTIRGMTVLRPLLAVSKERLAATARAAALEWIEDPSNEEPAFERVRIRQARHTLDELGLTPANLALSAARAGRASRALELGAADALRSRSELWAALTLAGYGRLSTRWLFGLPEELALRSLSRVLAGVSGRGAPRLARLEAVWERLGTTERGAWTLGGCKLVRSGEWLAIYREPGRNGLEEIRLEPGARALWDSRFAVGVDARAERPLSVGALGVSEFADVRARLARPVPRQAALALPCFRDDMAAVAIPQLAPLAPLAPLARTRADGGWQCQAAASSFFANFAQIYGMKDA